MEDEHAKCGDETRVEYNVPVHTRNDIRQAKGEKDNGPKAAVLWLAKLVPHGDDNGENAQYQPKGNVNLVHEKVFVEAVVEGGNHRANNLQRYAAVVELGEDFDHFGRGVAAKGVKERGEDEASDDAAEVDDQHEAVSGRLVCVHGDEGVDEEDEEDERTDAVRPNVARLRVHAKDGLGAGPEGGQWWSVAPVQVLIVLHPVG